LGFLAPLFLVATALAAVPLLLHLLHRHDSRRVAFPALRYLQRTEKEHARRIRLRQLLLLLLRTSVILLLVVAGARLYVRGRGAGHEPTAVAVVLDNSMSSGLVVGEERVLNRLKRLATETVSQATPDDRIWVIRAGEPWDVAPPGSPAEALGRIQETEVSAARGDLSAALSRARELVEGAGLPAVEIHLLSDLQSTAFARQGVARPAGDVPVVVYRTDEELPGNRYLNDVLVGGGLAPLAGQRSEVAVTVGSGGAPDSASVPLRLVVDGRIRGASSALPGRTVVLPVGPFPEGRVEGYVETDPDALRADDRRWFTFQVRPPPQVALTGREDFFLEQALAVLTDGGRIRRTQPAEADVLVSVGGEGLEGRRPGQAAVVVPSSDPTLLPALNRRLAAAGVPWRAELPSGEGEARLGESRAPLELAEVRIYRRLSLEPVGDAGTAVEVPVRLVTGEPWMVSGTTPAGSYLLIASPLDDEATTLPVSASMVPLLEWTTSRWSSRESGAPRVEAGDPLSVSSGATHVRAPDGTTHPVDGTLVFRETREPGIYLVLQGDSVLERAAVGAPPRESLLAPLDADLHRESVGTRLRVVDDVRDWPREVFVSRQGPELWKPLLLLALLLLLLESWVAAAGRSVGGTVPSALPSAESRSEEDRQEVRAPLP